MAPTRRVSYYATLIAENRTDDYIVAHSYLTWLCSTTSTTSATLSSTATAHFNSTNSTLVIATATTSIKAVASTVNASQPIEQSLSDADSIAKRDGTAKWALVVVVLARSILL